MMSESNAARGQHICKPLSSPLHIYIPQLAPSKLSSTSDRSICSLLALLQPNSTTTLPHSLTAHTHISAELSSLATNKLIQQFFATRNTSRLANSLEQSRSLMRRQGGNEASPSIIHTSSIALLQERFRNLQRVKEMREGRELQRVHHHSGDATDRDRSGSPLEPAPLNTVAASADGRPRWFLHPDLVRPSRPLHGPAGSYSGHGGNGVAVQASQPAAASSFGEVPRMQNSGYRADVDVDTSLHL